MNSSVNSTRVTLAAHLLLPYHLSFSLSFDQHSLLDLPAMVDLVLNVSQQEQIYYVGHSQGTVMGFAGFSSMPELASKIKLFVALAPVATVTYFRGLFRFLTDFYKEWEVCWWGSRSMLHSAGFCY